MQYNVYSENEIVGKITINQDDKRITFVIECDNVSQDIIRCYGKIDDKNILIDVLEPKNDKLYANKSFYISSFLNSHKIIPEYFFITNNKIDLQEYKKEKYIETGDNLIDDKIKLKEVKAYKNESGIIITSKFDKDKPFPLIFVATICKINDKGEAELKL